jgi:predicted nucleic acid-binding Zn ribbon protein
MENVANIVNGVLDARGWRGKVLEQMTVEIWPEIVGEAIARHTLAEKFKNGTLYVRARSPQWTQELHFQSNKIIARMNGRLRQPIVQKIRCSGDTAAWHQSRRAEAKLGRPDFPRCAAATAWR